MLYLIQILDKYSIFIESFLNTIFMLLHSNVAYERKHIMELLFVGIAIIVAVIVAVIAAFSAAAVAAEEDED